MDYIALSVIISELAIIIYLLHKLKITFTGEDIVEYDIDDPTTLD